MIKSIQTKIILIFFVLGIIIIGSLSFFHISMLEKMNQSIMSEEITQQEQFSSDIQEQIGQTEVITVIAIGVFAVITLIVGYFVSKSVVHPINELIDNAEKIAKGEEIEINQTNKKKTQVDELVNAFSLMTKELKQNLN